jgi:putative DNA primase/helicase
MYSTRNIAAALGGQVAGPNAALCPGPGHSPRDRSLAVRLDPAAPDGFLVHSHAGDDWAECRDYVRERLGLPAWRPGDEQCRDIPQQYLAKWDAALVRAAADAPTFTEDEIARIENASRLWDEGKDPRGTLAEKYLRDARKLDLPDNLAGTVLRFHARCPWRNENTGATDRVPALIVPFRSIDDNAITGIHRIALNSDGSKLGRRMLGVARLAAIKFDLAGGMLSIGEGVETCMAARQLGLGAAWALGSVGAISFFPLIDGVQQLLILGEAGDASARAIKFCSKRWRRAKRRVRIVMPNAGFSDLNDVLIAEVERSSA